MIEYENAYFIDKAGLALILSKKGVNQIHCLDIFGSDVEIDDEEACASLFSMVKDNLVETDENGSFYLDDAFEEACAAILDSEYIIAIYSGTGAESSIVIYINKEKATAVMQAKNRPACLKIFNIEFEDIQKYIDECAAKSIKSEEQPEGVLYIESLEFFGLDDDFEQIINNEKTVAFIDVFNTASEQSVKKAAIIDADNKRWLCIWDSDNYSFAEYQGDDIISAGDLFE